jgi:hypothetical protein
MMVNSNLTPLMRLTAKLKDDGVNFMMISDRMRDSTVIETFLAAKKIRWRFTYRGFLPPTDPIL